MNRKNTFYTTLLSFLITAIIVWKVDNYDLNTILSLFISVFSLLLLLLFIIKWFWLPIGSNSDRILFKSKLTQNFDKAISQGHSTQLAWLALVFIVLYVIMAGWMGTFNSFNLLPENVGGLNPFSLTFMLFTDSGTLGDALKAESHISGLVTLFCLTISILGALVFTGLLISVFSNYIQRRVEDFLNGKIRYKLSNHIIFIGYDDSIPFLINQIYSTSQEPPQSIIFTSSDTNTVRKKIEPKIAHQRFFEHVLFYCGQRNSEKALSQLCIDTAREIYIIGNHKNDNHDELNIQCLNCIIHILEQSNFKCNFEVRKPIYIQMEGHTRFKKSKLWWEKERLVEVRPFNTYVDWAKILLYGSNLNGSCVYPKIVDSTDNRIINVVIFGMNRFGRALGIEALSSLPDLFEPGGSEIKSRVTFICEDAAKEMDIFKIYYKELFNQIEYILIDFQNEKTIKEHYKPETEELPIAFEFVSSSAFNPLLYSFLEERNHDENYKMSIFACTEKDTTDSNIALSLPIANANKYILQRYGTASISEMSKHMPNSKSFYPFGMIDEGYDWNSVRNLDKSTVAENILKSGESAFDDGNYEKALLNYKQSLRIRQLIVGNNHIETAWTYYDIGILYYKLRDFDQSLNNFNKALAIRQEICGEYHPEVSNCFNFLGKTYREMAIKEERGAKDKFFNLALENLDKALSIRIMCFGEENDDVAASYNNIGNLYRDWERYKDSYDYLQKGYVIRARLLSKKRIKRTKLMDSKHNIGRLYTCVSKYDEALPLLLEAYKTYKADFREHHPYIGMACSSIGQLYIKTGNLKLAKQYYEEALDVYTKEYSTNRPNHDRIVESRQKIKELEELINETK